VLGYWLVQVKEIGGRQNIEFENVEVDERLSPGWPDKFVKKSPKM
jgi:hypothetical protein